MVPSSVARSGSLPRWNICVGCPESLPVSDDIHTCVFYGSGFQLQNEVFRPCYTRYHASCISVGPPFRSRLTKHGGGLLYPPAMTSFPFICELCTVRSVIGRELANTPADRKLICYERMRMIDAAHAWAPSTMTGIRLRLRRLALFGTQYGFTICRAPSLSHPPNSSIIPILWAMSAYTNQVSSTRRRLPGEDNHITYNTARSLQSAASAYFRWSRMLQFPEEMYQDGDRRLLGNAYTTPTDALIATLVNRGMKKRLGVSSQPAVAIQFHHVLFNQQHRTRLLSASVEPFVRYLLAAANLVELFAWGGWLRAAEVFSLNHGDVSTCDPADGAHLGLPKSVGALLLRLLPSTKSSPYATADVILADVFYSGLQVLKAWNIFWDCCVALGWTQGPLFRHSDGSVWTSEYYRVNHLYPLLHLQRLGGDAALRPYDDTPGNTIEAKFYSFHTYRRGGRSFVSRKREYNLRRATPAETVEHGRWRSRGSPSGDMPTHYREWTLEDRIFITLLCM